MGEVTKIAWCDHTFSPWEGCVKISPGCDGCYAAARDVRLHHGGNWGKDAARLMHKDAYWRQPLKWNKAAKAVGQRRRVFCGSLMDVMEDRLDLDEFRYRLYELILATQYLDWLLVTKRPMNFKRLLPAEWLHRSMPQNVWGITTVEADNYSWRMHDLLNIPFRVHGVSYEPALEAVDFRPWLERGIKWLIIGGESKQRGHVARDFHLKWAEDGIAACRETGRAPFVKQLGSFPVDVADSLFQIRHPKGEAMEEWPRSLQVQEFPKEGL
jgi:protein gp37